MEIITLWLLLSTGETVYQRATIPECEAIGNSIMMAETLGWQLRHKTATGDYEVTRAGCNVFELTASVGPCQDEDDA